MSLTNGNQKKSLVITDFNQKKYYDLQLVIDPTQKIECNNLLTRIEYTQSMKGKINPLAKKNMIKFVAQMKKKNKDDSNHLKLDVWRNIFLIKVVTTKAIRKFLCLDLSKIALQEDLQESLNICSIMLMNITNNDSIEKNKVMEIQETLFAVYEEILHKYKVYFGKIETAVLDNAVNSIQTMLNERSNQSPSYEVLLVMRIILIKIMKKLRDYDNNCKQSTEKVLKGFIEKEKYLSIVARTLYRMYSRSSYLNVAPLALNNLSAIVYLSSLDMETMANSEIQIIKQLNSVFCNLFITGRSINTALLSLELLIEYFLTYRSFQVNSIHNLITHTTQRLSFDRLNIDGDHYDEYFLPRINSGNYNQYSPPYIYRLWQQIQLIYQRKFEDKVLLPPAKPGDENDRQNALSMQIRILDNFSHSNNIALFDKFITSPLILEASIHTVSNYFHMRTIMTEYYIIVDQLIQGIDENEASRLIQKRLSKQGVYRFYYNRLCSVMEVIGEKFKSLLAEASSELTHIKELKNKQGITAYDLTTAKIKLLISGYFRIINHDHHAPKVIERVTWRFFSHRPSAKSTKTVSADESCNSPQTKTL